MESDQPQVTVNERFEVQFPERRPFFLENADYFTTETPLVFTRRIVDPEVGLKFTGRQGPWGFGTMLIDDEAPGALLAPTNPLRGEAADIGVLRAFRDFGDQSRAGALYAEREFGDTYNRVGALDSRVKLTDNWSTELLMVNTDTRTASGETFAGRQTNWRFDRNGRHALVHAHWTQQSDGFATPARNSRAQLSARQQGVARQRRVSVLAAGGLVARPDRPAPVPCSPGGSVGPADLRGAVARVADGVGGRQLILSFGTNNIRELLRPRDFPGLLAARDYKQERWYTEFLDRDVRESRVLHLLRRRHRDQPRARARRRARARGSQIFRDGDPFSAESAVADRHQLSVHASRRPNRRRRDLREPDPAQPLELSVHERDVGAVHRAARGDRADGADAARARSTT